MDESPKVRSSDMAVGSKNPAPLLSISDLTRHSHLLPSPQSVVKNSSLRGLIAAQAAKSVRFLRSKHLPCRTKRVSSNREGWGHLDWDCNLWMTRVADRTTFLDSPHSSPETVRQQVSQYVLHEYSRCQVHIDQNCGPSFRPHKPTIQP